MRPQVLVVDDEPQVHALVRVALEARGLEVLAATTTDEAIAAVRQNPGICALLLDRFVDEANVRDTLKRVRELNPRITCCIMTGAATPSLITDSAQREDEYVLPKPFSMHDLVLTVRDLIQSPGESSDS